MSRLDLLFERSRKTGDNLDPDLADTRRRGMEILRRGKVKNVDYARARATVKFGGQETAFLPWFTERAGPDITWWPPEPGEQVLVFAPSGNLKQGLILGSLYQPSGDFPAPKDRPDIAYIKFADGAEIWYDRTDHQLKVKVTQQGASVDLEIPDGHVHIKTRTVTIEGDVTITGNVRIDDDPDHPGQKGNLRVEHIVEADVALDHSQGPI